MKAIKRITYKYGIVSGSGDWADAYVIRQRLIASIQNDTAKRRKNRSPDPRQNRRKNNPATNNPMATAPERKLVMELLPLPDESEDQQYHSRQGSIEPRVHHVDLGEPPSVGDDEQVA